MTRVSDTRLRSLLEAMCRAVPEEMTELGYRRRDTCILSTRIATIVLRDQGIRARPLACQLMAGNAEWARVSAEFLERYGRWPTQREWTDGMWSVGIGYGTDPRAARPGYDGHLIAVVEERYGLDLTLDQASRPAKGFTTQPSYFQTPPEFLRGDTALPLIIGDAYLRYDPTPEERSFLRAPDWTEVQRYGRLLPTQRIRQRLAR
jgi:hypothetical protein